MQRVSNLECLISVTQNNDLLLKTTIDCTLFHDAAMVTSLVMQCLLLVAERILTLRWPTLLLVTSWSIEWYTGVWSKFMTVAMTIGIVCVRLLHLEVTEGLMANFSRSMLSFVGGHAVSQAIIGKKVRNRHIACTLTFLKELWLHPAHLMHDTESCHREAFLPPMLDKLNEFLLDVFNNACWALVQREMVLHRGIQ